MGEEEVYEEANPNTHVCQTKEEEEEEEEGEERKTDRLWSFCCKRNNIS